MLPAMPETAFVAGATGYTGREVVQCLVGRGVRAVAHVRPDSPSLAEQRARFEAMGAEVDATPWEPVALAGAFARIEPTVVFALLGTTKRRARAAEERGSVETYETVDYGLTAMLIEAAAGAKKRPRFVYLSSAGVTETTTNAYLQARARVERLLRDRGLAYRVARPSIITGEDREDDRPLERAGATALNGALSVVAALGGKKLRDRYASTDAKTLAAALVRIGLTDGASGRIYESEDLRA